MLAARKTTQRVKAVGEVMGSRLSFTLIDKLV